jgi:hypothetical protein
MISSTVGCKLSVVQTAENSLPEKSPDNFTQWAPDNVDHNVATLGGFGTFHGMGMISMSVHELENDEFAVASGGFGETAIKRCSRVRVDKR